MPWPRRYAHSIYVYVFSSEARICGCRPPSRLGHSESGNGRKYRCSEGMQKPVNTVSSREPFGQKA
eukprot:328975-Pleurochrysis_carterae.AAC.2